LSSEQRTLGNSQGCVKYILAIFCCLSDYQNVDDYEIIILVDEFFCCCETGGASPYWLYYKKGK